MKLSSLLLPSLLATSALLLGASPAASASRQAGTRPAGEPATLRDAELEPYRIELLELAFQAATAIPVHPLIKDRCSLQASAVEACIELEQLERAGVFAEQILNWRRGEMFAELGFHLAQRGNTPEVQRCLARAEEVARGLRIEDDDVPMDDDGEVQPEQAWRRDRILVTIARAHAVLGENDKAVQLEAGVVESEAGKVDGVRAARLGVEEFEGKLAALKVFLAGTDLDQARSAFEVCAQLYNRFYSDAERRARVEEAVRESEHKLPGFLRIELQIQLAEFALDHGDAKNALDIVNRAKLIAGACTDVPLVARLAKLRHQVGDRDKARTEADSALELFDQQRAEIVDIYRAGTLRPLAEAYNAMGDTAAALRVYARVLEEGVGNPNSRPRAEDLVATCLSLARHGVQPDDKLKARIYEIFGALSDPW